MGALPDCSLGCCSPCVRRHRWCGPGAELSCGRRTRKGQLGRGARWSTTRYDKSSWVGRGWWLAHVCVGCVGGGTGSRCHGGGGSSSSRGTQIAQMLTWVLLSSCVRVHRQRGPGAGQPKPVSFIYILVVVLALHLTCTQSTSVWRLGARLRQNTVVMWRCTATVVRSSVGEMQAHLKMCRVFACRCVGVPRARLVIRVVAHIELELPFDVHLQMHTAAGAVTVVSPHEAVTYAHGDHDAWRLGDVYEVRLQCGGWCIRCSVV